MTPPRLARASALQADIRAALDAAALPRVTVTLDALDIPSAARHGVVVLTPPALRFPTFDQVETDWELGVIAGPADNLEHAWSTIDSIVHALFLADLDLADAQPDMFPAKGSALPLPGYLITLNTETTYEKATQP